MPDISFHGTMPFAPDTSNGSSCFAWMLCGEYAGPPHEDIYIAVNSHWDGLLFEVPQASNRAQWKVAINTSAPAPDDIHDACCRPPLQDSEHVIVGGRSVMVLTAGRAAT
jgi:glycogen operon protein